MIKYSGIGDQMPTGISDQVLRNTHLVRRMCHEGSDPASEQNYELNLKYEYPKIGLLELIFTLIMDLIIFLFVYIPLNIANSI